MSSQLIVSYKSVFVDWFLFILFIFILFFIFFVRVQAERLFVNEDSP